MASLTTDQILVLLGYAGAIITVYVTMNTRIRSLEIEVHQLQKAEDRNNSKFETILEKIQDMHKSFNELLIEFANIKKH